MLIIIDEEKDKVVSILRDTFEEIVKAKAHRNNTCATDEDTEILEYLEHFQQ